MTLILSATTYNKVVQASDRRLTWPDGSIHDDQANKTVCVFCPDSHFAITYTGLAFLGTALKKADDWLVDYLFSIKAYEMTLKLISEAVERQLTNTLKVTPVTNKAFTLVLAGYRESWPFIMSISNVEGENFE